MVLVWFVLSVVVVVVFAVDCVAGDVECGSGVTVDVVACVVVSLLLLCAVLLLLLFLLMLLICLCHVDGFAGYVIGVWCYCCCAWWLDC